MQHWKYLCTAVDGRKECHVFGIQAVIGLAYTAHARAWASDMAYYYTLYLDAIKQQKIQ